MLTTNYQHTSTYSIDATAVVSTPQVELFRNSQNPFGVHKYDRKSTADSVALETTAHPCRVVFPIGKCYLCMYVDHRFDFQAGKRRLNKIIPKYIPCLVPLEVIYTREPRTDSNSAPSSCRDTAIRVQSVARGRRGRVRAKAKRQRQHKAEENWSWMVRKLERHTHALE